MISNLPIFRGEKIYGGFMTYSPWEWEVIRKFDEQDDWRSHHWSGAFCNGEDVFIPRSMPMIGTYDEYGRIEVDPVFKQRLSVKVTTDTLAEDIVVRVTALDKYSHWPQQPYSLEDLISLARYGTLHVKYPGNGQTVPVGLWMVKASVYDKMCEVARLYTGDRWWNEQSASQFSKEKAFFVEAARKNWYDGDLVALARELFEIRMDFSVFQNYFGSVSPNAGSFTRWVEKNKATPEMVAELFDEVKEFMDFVYAMRLGRYAFLPVSGAGSQDASMTIQKAVAEVILAATDPYEE